MKHFFLWSAKHMHFMNEIEIDMHAERWRSHPVLGPATRFLSEFRHKVNENSDGWPYWSAPVRAASRLFTMIERPETATAEAYKKALVPIKSFCTRHKLAMPSPY